MCAIPTSMHRRSWNSYLFPRATECFRRIWPPTVFGTFPHGRSELEKRCEERHCLHLTQTQQTAGRTWSNEESSDNLLVFCLPHFPQIELFCLQDLRFHWNNQRSFHQNLEVIQSTFCKTGLVLWRSSDTLLSANKLSGRVFRQSPRNIELIVRSLLNASSCQSVVNSTCACRPSVLTSIRNVVTSKFSCRKSS